jgi:hypothetical protein
VANPVQPKPSGYPLVQPKPNEYPPSSAKTKQLQVLEKRYLKTIAWIIPNLRQLTGVHFPVKDMYIPSQWLLQLHF